MSQDILEISDRDTSFSAHESDEEKLYDAIKIVDERRGQYKIKWDGVDGKGNPWEDSWTNKRDCTDDIVAAWKLEKAKEKAQKKLKAEQKKAKKLSRARISTASKASTSRQTTSVAPSARSLRSRTAVPAEPRYDEYDSISRTPGNRKKRRLSSVPVQSPQDDSPSLRRAKKPRLAEPIERSPSPKEEEEEIVPDSDDDMPPVVRPNGKSKEADLSAPSRDVSDSDDEMAPVRRLNSKGKEVDRSVPAPKKPRGRPPKTVSLLQRQRDKFMDECDNFGDETPMNATPKSPVAAVPASGRFFTPAPLPLTQQSNILSPGGQARLDRFDDELAAPTQPQGSQKPPLFYPASSEERDSLPRSHSPSLPPRSPWNPRSSPARRLDSPTASEYAQPHSPPAPSRSPSHSPVPRAPSLPASDRTQSPSPAPQMAIQRHSPAPRAPSLPASDRTQSPSPAPQTVIQRHSPAPRAPSLPASDRTQSPSPAPQTAIQRHTSGRRTANDSYRIGDVPETQSSPESPPRAIASPKRSIISKMKPRSKTSTSTSMMFPPAKRVAPIPMMTAARFATQIREPDAGEEADVEEVDELMSSIEQFSSPEKKNKRPGRAPLDKGKGRQREVEDEDSEDEDSDDEKKAHLRMLKRGIEMAEAARAERQVEMAAYAPRRATFEEILQARGQEGTSMSTTESDILMAATGNGVGNLRHDIEALRQEEEENTQDVMTDYRTVVDPPDEHSDDDDVETSMPENLADLVNGQERNGDKAGDRSDAESSAGTVGDRSEGRERNRDAAGQRSDAEDSVDDVRNPSEDRETDVDGHLDIDGPERSAWNEEHASQLLQEASGDTSQDVLHDESMEDLLYPDDSPEVPKVPSSPIPVSIGHIAQRRKSKSRSTSARSRKPVDDDVELPPTASTRENTPEPVTVPVEAPADPRHLDAAMSLLNVKSDENHRLEALLAEERALLAEERAKNLVLQERAKTLEQQPFSSSDSDLETRLKQVEELLAAALQSKAAAEAERDVARRDQATAEQQREVFQECYATASRFASETASENKKLEQRAKIAEEATREGIATIKATFDLREVSLKSETRDWRNQANFLREQAIRTNDPDLRRRAAEHPEIVARCERLLDENEDLKERLQTRDEDLLVKQDEIDRLQERLTDAAEELEGLTAGNLNVGGDFEVLRCGWRAEATNTPCPALCRTREDLELHASMHVTKALVDPLLFGV